MLRYLAGFMFILGSLLILGTAQPSANAQTPQTDEDLIAQGQYLAIISNCRTCHTPFEEKYTTSSELSDLQTLSLREVEALDTERAFAGGRPFDLGPQGVVISSNLTSDEATGLGAWTDEEIERSLRTGISRDGRQMHPIMPYFTYANMSTQDMTALIAFLRTLEPLENEIPVSNLGLPNFALPMPSEEIGTPDGSDLAARGQYLLTGVIACTDCHTPLNPETGEPDFSKYFGGGQPFEGPWGIVYGANITPHPESGIGEWSSEDYYRAIASGVRPDGRRLVLMPWQDYATLTTTDLEAVVNFLQNGLEAVDNEIPAPALNEGFTEVIEISN